MSAWKACDLRGVVPDEVSPELYEQIGRHVAAALSPSARRVLVAGDFRTSTPELKAALARGLVRGGANVIDAGRIPTPIAYFAQRQLGTDAVFIVTASHNPPNHNGLKFTIGPLPPTEAEIHNLRISLARPASESAPGTIDRIDPVPDYIHWIETRWNSLARQPGLSVVLDGGNGAWSEIAPAIYARLGFQVHPLFCEIDGAFPNRPPDSSRPGSLGALADKIRETAAAFGVAWDGDGDRVSFLDGRGRFVSADQVSLLLVRRLLKSGSGDRVVYDIKLSGAVRRTVESLGGDAQVERSGHAFIKRRMILGDCMFGCEVSGHYFHRELGGGDDGLFTSLLMAQIIQQQGPLDVLVDALPELFVTPDLRVSQSRIEFSQMVSRLRSILNPARELNVDGARLETADGSVLVRESVTEPAITLRVEGVDRNALDRLIEQCKKALPEIEDQLGSLS